MLPGRLPPVAAPRLVHAISPSRFTGMQACALREVWSAGHVPGLLPASPAARLGTAGHRLLEEAGRGDFFGVPESQIELRWDELVSVTEAAMAANWLERHLLPLSRAVPDFAVRRIRAVTRAKQLAAEADRAKSMTHADAEPYGGEVAVMTPDGKAVGRIDAVLRGENGPLIRDYKSGAIHEQHTTTIKSDYVTQLKLYAAMYAEMTGVWAERLEVMALSGSAEAVPFDTAECAALLHEARTALDAINKTIAAAADMADAARLLARPAPSTCIYCAYRPHCSAYTQASRSSPELKWPNDVWGPLRERRTLGNGLVMIAVDTAAGTVVVRGLTPGPDRHPALDIADVGSQLSIFGMRWSGGGTYSEGNSTVIYLNE